MEGGKSYISSKSKKIRKKKDIEKFNIREEGKMVSSGSIHITERERLE